MSAPGSLRRSPSRRPERWLSDTPPADPSDAAPELVGQIVLGEATWRLTLTPIEAMGPLWPALAGLAARSGGGNPFFEPGVQIAAHGRLASHDKRMLVLWQDVDGLPMARLALPVHQGALGLPQRPVLSGWTDVSVPLGLPLLDTTAAAETGERFATLLPDLLQQAGHPLALPFFPLDDPLAAPLLEALRRAGIVLDEAGVATRAALAPSRAMAEDAPLLPDWLAPRRRRDFARQLRNLASLGTVRFEAVDSFWSVLVAFEEFLVLEARGWKGRRGTAAHIIRRLTPFYRQSVMDLAHAGRVTLCSLRLDGRAIASLIVVHTGGRHYPWKIAYDEVYRAHSPGAQLMVRAGRFIAGLPGFAGADSLGPAGGWVDALWPDRVRFGTLLLDAGPGAAERLTGLREAIERELRLKRLARRLLGR